MRGTIPDDLPDRPKWGFSVPLAEWIRGPLLPVVRDVLLDAQTRRRNYFNQPVVGRLLSEHVNRGIDRATEIWLLFVLELWHRRFIDGAPESALL